MIKCETSITQYNMKSDNKFLRTIGCQIAALITLHLTASSVYDPTN